MSKGSILHCNMGEKSLFFLFFGFLLGYKKRILHIHSSIRPEGKIEKIERKILTFLCMLFATDYFACGEEAAKWFYGKRQNKVYIMRNAIDLNKYAFSQELRNHYRLKYCINDKTVYGNVGRLSPPKNHKFLLDVFDCLHKRDNKSCLLLVGTGELEQQVIEKINHLGLQDSVIMVGLCDKVYEILNCFDAFLMPSISEGVPVAAVEALANGLVVYCSSAVTKEIQVSNHVQYLSLDKSAEEWANVIATGDTTRKDVSNDLAKIGFDIKTQVGKLMKIYQLKES